MKKFLLLLILIFNLNSLFALEGSVICLHGFFRSSKCMVPMRHALNKAGFRVFLIDYRSRGKMIEHHAADLVQICQDIAKAYPGEPIYFVTHSLGGIIVRAAVNHPLCPDEAKFGRAVLLAPPNQGACLARNFRKYSAMRFLFGKRAGHQLLNYEAADMQNFGNFPDTMQVMVIAGDKNSRFSHKWIQRPNDGKVAVDETYLSTPHYHCVNHVSHSWIMTSRQSIWLAKTFFLQHAVSGRNY